MKGNYTLFSVFYIWYNPFVFIKFAFGMYINVFTRNSFQEAGIEVVNIPVDAAQKPLMYSAGIHPWYIDKDNYEKALEQFYIISSEKECVAIGACGLDKSFESNYSEQEKIFIQQIKTANIIKKPLLLYCFKAWPEVTAMLGKQKNKMPVIILSECLPDSNDELNALNNFYVAFDKSVYFNTPKAIQWLKHLSAKKILFYNSDEDLSIKDIYQSAAQLLQIDLKTLQQQVLENFYKAFLLEKVPL